MSYKNSLEALKKIDGFICAGLISNDGELITATRGDSIEMEMIGALVNNLVVNAQKTAEKIGLGRCIAMNISAFEGTRIFIKYFSSNEVSFSLILVCGEKSPPGMVNLRFDQIIPNLAKTLAIA